MMRFKEFMSMKLFVGSLGSEVGEPELQEAFAACGTVLSAVVIMDRDTGRSKGFGFVEMSTQAEGMKAIQALNGQSIGGRVATVNEARPKEDNRSRRPFDNSAGRGRR